MVALIHYLLSFLSPVLLKQVPLHTHHDVKPTKSIAIIGAGSAGLAVLKTMKDIDPNLRYHWDIVLYEERDNLGGRWYNLHALSWPKI